MNRLRATLAVGIVAGFTLTAGAAAQQPAAAPAPAPDGAALYTRLCSNCHGETGTPPEAIKTLFPAIAVLSDSALQASLNADSIVVMLQGVGTGKHKKPFTDRMTHEEMVAVAAFVKSLGAGHGP
jgi:mono/diheme cytochrome c family protein